MTRLYLVPLFLFAAALPALSGPPPGYKVETVGTCTSPDVSDAMKQELQDHGLRVSSDSGPLCDIWLRKVLPQSTGTGTDYSTIAAGTFVGVIQYLSNGGDYRGQTVKTGIYTMRYQTMPSDGNHMGVADTPDFFALLPPGADKDPDAVMGYQDVIRLGKQASGLSHLYPLYLPPPNGGSAAGIQQMDSHWVLQTTTKAQPKGGAAIDFPVALVLVGKSEGQ